MKMARGKKTGGRDFKPGQIANPNGAPRVPEEVKIARQLSQNQLILIFNKLLHMTGAELKAHWNNPETPVFERIVAKILNQADVLGDHHRLDFILNRLIGKVTEKVDVKLPTATIIKRVDGSEIELGAKYIEEEKE
jgi:hypothetical protein